MKLFIDEFDYESTLNMNLDSEAAKIIFNLHEDALVLQEQNTQLKAKVEELEKELWHVRYEKAMAQGANHAQAKEWADKLEASND